MLPVSSSRVILPPSSKQLRVRPDGGVGPIPLYTGWTLGPVPKHIAAWAHASKRAHADGSLDPQSSSHGLSADSAEVRGGDALLASISNGTPGARLPLVPCPDETFVSRDTGVTGEAARGCISDTWQGFGGDIVVMLSAVLCVVMVKVCSLRCVYLTFCSDDGLHVSEVAFRIIIPVTSPYVCSPAACFGDSSGGEADASVCAVPGNGFDVGATRLAGDGTRKRRTSYARW